MAMRASIAHGKNIVRAQKREQKRQNAALKFHCGDVKVFPQDVEKYVQTPFESGAPVQCFYQRAFTCHCQTHSLQLKNFKGPNGLSTLKSFIHIGI